MRETPEGKFHHEKMMYFDRCMRIHDFRKPTIAAVQGSCIAAGLMLAAMCDLIVAADDAVFSNPVLRLTGAGVELLVEPWELGIRKAKEFLLTGETIDAQEAWRLGLVNRVVPRAELVQRTRELADRIALVPAVTAQMVKDTLNQTGTLMGKRDALKYHFMAHHWVHNTRHRARRAGGTQGEGLHAGGHGRDGRGHRRSRRHERNGTGPSRRASGSSTSARGSPRPFCAGLLGELGADVIKVELPGEGDFMRTMGPFVPVDDGPGYSLSWAVEGRGRRGVTCDLRQPEGKELFKRWWRRRTCSARTSGPAPWSGGASGPTTCPTSSSTSASASSGRTGPYAAAAGPRPTGHRLRRAAPPDRRTRPPAGAARGDRLGLPDRRLRGLRRRGRALDATPA